MQIQTMELAFVIRNSSLTLIMYVRFSVVQSIILKPTLTQQHVAVFRTLLGTRLQSNAKLTALNMHTATVKQTDLAAAFVILHMHGLVPVVFMIVLPIPTLTE